MSYIPHCGRFARFSCVLNIKFVKDVIVVVFLFCVLFFKVLESGLHVVATSVRRAPSRLGMSCEKLLSRVLVLILRGVLFHKRGKHDIRNEIRKVNDDCAYTGIHLNARSERAYGISKLVQILYERLRNTRRLSRAIRL